MKCWCKRGKKKKLQLMQGRPRTWHTSVRTSVMTVAEGSNPPGLGFGDGFLCPPSHFPFQPLPPQTENHIRRVRKTRGRQTAGYFSFFFFSSSSPFYFLKKRSAKQQPHMATIKGKAARRRECARRRCCVARSDRGAELQPSSPPFYFYLPTRSEPPDAAGWES